MNQSMTALLLVTSLAACGGGGDAVNDTTPVAAATGTPAAAPAADSAGAAAASGAMLDPNAATRDQLAALPGMDAALADSLVARRPYANMLGVDSVLSKRLSEPQRDTLYARLWKPIDLNTASKAEIQLIPGVGAKMTHEFEEYRPYTNIERFRREIGKYVDKDEVARLERYVMIK